MRKESRIGGPFCASNGPNEAMICSAKIRKHQHKSVFRLLNVYWYVDMVVILVLRGSLP